MGTQGAHRVTRHAEGGSPFWQADSHFLNAPSHTALQGNGACPWPRSARSGVRGSSGPKAVCFPCVCVIRVTGISPTHRHIFALVSKLIDPPWNFTDYRPSMEIPSFSTLFILPASLIQHSAMFPSALLTAPSQPSFLPLPP